MELGGGDDDAPGGRDESPSSADAATTSMDLPEPPAAPPAIVAPSPQKQKIHWQPHEDALLLETVDRIGLGYWAAIAQAVGDTQQRCANRYRYLTSGKARKVQHPPPKASTWAPPLMVAPPAPPAQPPAPLAPAATAAASSGAGVVYVESTAIGDGEEDEAAVELVDCVALPNTAVHIRLSGAAVDPANLPPADMTTSTGIFAFRPDDRVPRLSADQLERVIDLLGRRCVADAENKRAVRTLVPLVRRLVGRGPHAESFAPAFTLGLHGASKVLNEAAVAELNVEMLVDLCDGEVQGAAVLSKTFTTATRGFVVLQLIAVEESVEKSGVGSRILEAACALAVEHDPSGSLLVPATAKWWEGTSKSGWLVEAKMAEHTRELSTLPCLFQMSVIKVLRWGCNEPRNGWLHAGPPQLPHQLSRPRPRPPPPPPPPRVAPRPPPSRQPTKSAPATLPAPPAKVQQEPWWMGLGGYVPPNGPASQYEADAQRPGRDGRMWRSVDIYEGGPALMGEGKNGKKKLIGYSYTNKRRKVCTAWMPEGEDHKLLKPPEDLTIVKASGGLMKVVAEEKKKAALADGACKACNGAHTAHTCKPRLVRAPPSKPMQLQSESAVPEPSAEPTQLPSLSVGGSESGSPLSEMPAFVDARDEMPAASTMEL